MATLLFRMIVLFLHILTNLPLLKLPVFADLSIRGFTLLLYSTFFWPPLNLSFCLHTYLPSLLSSPSYILYTFFYRIPFLSFMDLQALLVYSKCWFRLSKYLLLVCYSYIAIFMLLFIEQKILFLCSQKIPHFSLWFMLLSYFMP